MEAQAAPIQAVLVEQVRSALGAVPQEAQGAQYPVVSVAQVEIRAPVTGEVVEAQAAANNLYHLTPAQAGVALEALLVLVARVGQLPVETETAGHRQRVGAVVVARGRQTQRALLAVGGMAAVPLCGANPQGLAAQAGTYLFHRITAVMGAVVLMLLVGVLVEQKETAVSVLRVYLA